MGKGPFMPATHFMLGYPRISPTALNPKPQSLNPKPLWTVQRAAESHERLGSSSSVPSCCRCYADFFEHRMCRGCLGRAGFMFGPRAG